MLDLLVCSFLDSSTPLYLIKSQGRARPKMNKLCNLCLELEANLDVTNWGIAVIAEVFGVSCYKVSLQIF